MLALCPPEYMPRPEVMALAHAARRLVLLDTLAYRRRTFQNRARLRNPNGWQWISVPLAARPSGTPIRRVGLDTDAPWRGKHRRAFEYNYRTSPYFEFFEPQFLPLFDRPWTRLGDLTCASATLLAEMLDLQTSVTRASDLPGAAERDLSAPDALAAALAEAFPDDAPARLVLAPDARASRRRARAPEAALATHVLHLTDFTYRQNFDGFEPGMSAADLIFNVGPRARLLLAEHTTVESIRAGSGARPRG
jgi:hypothetical protein